MWATIYYLNHSKLFKVTLPAWYQKIHTTSQHRDLFHKTIWNEIQAANSCEACWAKVKGQKAQTALSYPVTSNFFYVRSVLLWQSVKLDILEKSKKGETSATHLLRDKNIEMEAMLKELVYTQTRSFYQKEKHLILNCWWGFLLKS